MKPPIEWLLEGPAWIEYRTRLDILAQPTDDPQVQSAQNWILADGQVQHLLSEVTAWDHNVVSSHKNAAQLFHKLTFLADLGLTVRDPGISNIITRILAHVSSEGPPQVLMNIPAHFGGSGEDQWAWALCDAPLITYALLKFGLEENPAVKLTVDYLTSLVGENGWHCGVSKELGKFRGPGRKDDPCPFATLAMLKMLSQTKELHDSPAC
ncbi:MAG: hypothetical protein ACPL1K_04295, partial [Candidatus Kryptoniota bacterium]